MLLAPVYAALLAGAAELAAPVLESDPRAHYETQGSKIVAVRNLVVNGEHVTARLGLADGKYAWSLTLLLAALLAVPEWQPSRRRRALVSGFLAMAAVHFVNLLVNVLYTQMRPAPGWTPPEFPEPVEWAASTASMFFDTVGNGFFAIALFVLLVARYWRARPAAVVVGRNELCPCGSGRKAKRCCQRDLATA